MSKMLGVCVALFFLFLGCTQPGPQAPANQTAEIKMGTYDLNGHSYPCKMTYDRNSFTMYTEYLGANGERMGYCSNYSGPGGSGWKGGCDGALAIPIETGPYAGRKTISIACNQ